MVLLGSINVNGLRNVKKRQNTFTWFKQKKYDCILLQETHCAGIDEAQEWSKEWGGYSEWYNGTRLSKGVAILLGEHAPLSVISSNGYNDGRIISFKVEINELNIQIINIYAPNNSTERKHFINNINNIIDINCINIIAGDFNLVQNSTLDREPSKYSSDAGYIELTELMETYDFEDVFRAQNPDKMSFTFSRGDSKSRIDYFLTPITRRGHIKSSSIFHFPFSDHDIVNISTDFKKFDHGPGVWKMNVATIYSAQFQESIENLWPIWKNSLSQYANITVWWEIIKCRIKQLTIEISRSLNINKHTISKFEKRIDEIKDSDKVLDKKEFLYLKEKIKDFYEKQTAAAMVRSRIKYYEEGEKSTKYFLNMEKKNVKNKTWSKIKCADGTYKTDIQSIIKEQTTFYQSLFTSNGFNSNDAKYFLQYVNKTLNEQEQVSCDRDVTEEEIFKIIKQLKLNKSPGDDGIVSEFYIRYWYLIKEELTNVIKYIFLSNTLAPSQQRAMLTLLYKKGEREDIANWRPISLLNVDYKIITKILAERLKPLLPNIIHPDQKGYVNGRNIFEANRLLKYVIEYSEENKINSSIIFIDYQKAFDRVKWGWALQCLEKFNFGPKIIQWIHMVYKNAKTCLLTNGYRSCYFPISRSMRQGCPVSPLIFILQAEPLACAKRKNKNIIGFPMPNAEHNNNEETEVKINAYVDDAQLFNSSENSIKESFKMLDRYENASRAKIHKTKTTALYIGPWKTKKPEFEEITWTNKNVKTLGVHHGYHINQQEIWMEKITKIKTCIQVWKSRNLSLRGKVLIIKTFLISQIGYELEMNGIPKNKEKEINTLIWNF